MRVRLDTEHGDWMQGVGNATWIAILGGIQMKLMDCLNRFCLHTQ